MQGRVRHRRAADEHRLELGHRRELAGAADLDVDVVEPRRLLLRRVLLRHGPARLARLEAEPLLQLARVDLVDDAVDLVGQLLAQRRDPRVKGNKAGSAIDARVIRTRRQAHRVEGVEQLGLRRWHGPALHVAEAVGEEAERPLRRVLRVELAHDAGRGIARIDEDLLVLRAALDELSLPLVQRREVVEPHEDLAAHLEHLRGHALQQPGHVLDRAHGMRHVLAGFAIAARRRLHELARFVAQVDREAVELHLGVVGDRRIVVAEAEGAAHARVELPRAAGGRVGLGLDRQHRHRVHDRHQPFEHGADDALGRRIGRHQLGVRGLERLQLLEQRVVLGVGNLGRVEHVVGTGMTEQDFAQLGGAGLGAAAGGPRLVVRRRRGHASTPQPARPGSRSRCVLPAPERREVAAAARLRPPCARARSREGGKRKGRCRGRAVHLADQTIDDAARRPAGEEPRQRSMARCFAGQRPRGARGLVVASGQSR